MMFDQTRTLIAAADGVYLWPGVALARGDVETAQGVLDQAGLPPVSPNGARLMRAIAKRQRLALPDVPVAGHQQGTVWDEAFAAEVAVFYDDVAGQARGVGEAVCARFDQSRL